MSQNLVLRNRQAPGDILMITAAVRDLHLQFPGQFVTDILTCDQEAIWANNPFITKLDPTQATNIVMRYGDQLTAADATKMHFCASFHDALGKYLKIKLTPSALRPDIYFTDEERANPLVKGDYWLIMAGGKSDMTAKIWPHEQFQRVVDMLKGEIAFVQAGGGPNLKRPSHFHTPLTGVVDLLGATNFRQLMRLALHAKGVVCGITCTIHLAAALNKPCVVIAGGREPPCWEAYTKETWKNNGLEPPAALVEHQFLHTIGQLNCCANKSCWKHGIGEMEVKPGKRDKNCRNIGESKRPACLELVTPEMVVAAVRSYGTPKAKIEDMEVTLPPPPPAAVVAQAACRVLTEVNEPVAGTEERRGVMLDTVGKPAICVLLYGNFEQLHKRCISSILDNTPADKYKLIVGFNQVCAPSIYWVNAEVNRRKVDNHMLIEPDNIFKYPMMRKMFEVIDNSWVVWFDDDSHIKSSPNWLQVLAAFYATGRNAGYHCFGKKYYYHLKPGQIDWVKTAKWYRGRPFRQDKNHDTVDFCTGGWWAAGLDTLRALDWPDPRIRHNGGDVMFGAALHQNEFGIQQVRIPGVIISDHTRRGYSELHPGIQVDAPAQAR